MRKRVRNESAIEDYLNKNTLKKEGALVSVETITDTYSITTLNCRVVDTKQITRQKVLVFN
jgi:hypothetical protein